MEVIILEHLVLDPYTVDEEKHLDARLTQGKSLFDQPPQPTPFGHLEGRRNSRLETFGAKTVCEAFTIVSTIIVSYNFWHQNTVRNAFRTAFNERGLRG